MGYQVFVDGDQKQYWTWHEDYDSALDAFLEECQDETCKVSMVWEGPEYEPE